VATSISNSNAGYCLLLPGEVLDLSTLLSLKKFRGRGNKDGALEAMRLLQSDDLGKLEEKESHRGSSAIT
jgi:hypothetical protein